MSLYFPPIENFTADGTTEAQFKAALTSLHAVIASLYAGQTAPAAIFTNPQRISADVAVPAGYNGISAGPITIDDGVNVVIADNSTWSIT
jgi:hypothetical protein